TLSKGRDSALHSGVPELGIFGNTSMLGANLPVAAGLALTFKMEQTDNVVVAYFGEGASNTGDFHEGLNFAGVHRLPVVFVCENNQYAISVPLRLQAGNPDVVERAAGYGMEGVVVDGTDVPATCGACEAAVGRGGAGVGPAGVRFPAIGGLMRSRRHRLTGSGGHGRRRKPGPYVQLRQCASACSPTPTTRSSWTACQSGCSTPSKEST